MNDDTPLLNHLGAEVTGGVERVPQEYFGKALDNIHHGNCYPLYGTETFYRYIGDKKTELAKPLLELHPKYKDYLQFFMDVDNCELVWTVNHYNYHDQELKLGEPFASAKFRRECERFKRTLVSFAERKLTLLVFAPSKAITEQGTKDDPEPVKYLASVHDKNWRSWLALYGGKVFNRDVWLDMDQWRYLVGQATDYTRTPEFIKLHKQHIKNVCLKVHRLRLESRAHDRKIGAELLRLFESTPDKNALLLELAGHAAISLGDRDGDTNETLCPEGEHMEGFTCPHGVTGNKRCGHSCGHDYRLCFFSAIAKKYQ